VHLKTRIVGFALLSTAVVNGVGHAQPLPAPPDTGITRVRVGPLWLKPTLSLTNVGIDTNLFNEAKIAEPRQDVAVTFVPQTEILMRMGRTWMTGNVRQDLIWFRDYRDQRSANGSYRGGWYIPLTRLSILAEGGYTRSRERPNYEIDLRAPRQERLGAVTTELRTGSRTYIGARGWWRVVQFAGGEFFGGQDLREELDRTRTIGTATFRHELTPMTSLSVEASLSRDRFAYSPDRDAEAAQVVAGLRFDPTALIKGHALVGYQRFAWNGSDIPEYRGPTVTASLSYVARTSTRLTMDALRDVEPSFDPNLPYYVQTGLSTTLAQRLVGPVDVQARVGVRTLDYRARAAGLVPQAPRRDRVTLFGGGIGYRLTRSMRVAADIEAQRRAAPVLLRSYQGERFGLSITWTP